METEKLEQQVASVERGMALLKREHLAMLTGLQLEISRLKRRCSGQSHVVYTAPYVGYSRCLCGGCEVLLRPTVTS